MNRKRTSQFKQGIYRPQHQEKYKGTFPITYRSSWELKLMRWCDLNPNVLTWGSESVVVPYQNPLTGRVSRYFIDFNVCMRDRVGELKKFLIEVKPFDQTQPPVQKKNTKSHMRRLAEYVKNQAKWKAATDFAANKGYQFVVLTEKQLGI